MSGIVIPPPLQPGDTVALLSTARKINLPDLVPAITLLQSWGLKVALGSTIGLENHQFAGSITERTANLQAALDNPEVKAIFCARGGYGTAQIIDQLHFTQFARYPKWIVGFSDITVLHSHLHTTVGAATLHATMPINYPQNTPQALSSLHQALFSPTLPHYTFAPHPLNQIGTAQGVLVGGNLSLLYALIGTPSDLDTAGKILFIEDLDEYLYHIDRMMNALQRSGKLHRLAGLLVGGMTDMKDNATPFGEDAEQIIARYALLYGFPMAFGFPAGHIPDNRTLALGIPVCLQIQQDECKLEFG